MHSAVGRGGDEDAGSRFTKILHPERDLALNWTIDVASVLGEYLDELHGAAGSLQDGASLNFVEAALVVQGSAGIYSRKTDYLHSLVLHALTTLTTGETNDSSNDGEDSGDAQGNGSDGDDCDLHRFLLLDDVEVVGSGTDQSRLDMREKDQRKTPEDEDDDEEGGLADAGGGVGARQGSKLPPRAPPILLTVEEELDGGKGSSTVTSAELSSFKMAGFVSHVSGSVFLEAQDGDVMDALLRLPRRRPAHFRAAMSPGSPAFSFPQPGLSPDCTPPLPRKGGHLSPYAEKGKAVAEDMGGAGCAQWGDGVAGPSNWQAAEGMGMGTGTGDDDDEDGMGTAGGFDCGDWAEAAAGGADAHGSQAGEWSGEAAGSGSGAAGAGNGGVGGVPGQSGSAQNRSGSRGGSGKGSASGRGRGQEEAAAEYDPFAPLDPDDAACMPLRPLRKGRPYLRAKRKTDGGDWSSRLSDPSVCLTFPLLAGKGRGMILPDIESIIQRAVMRDGKRQRVGVPGRSAEDGGSQKQAGSALEPPVGNVFADLEADADEAYGQAHPGGGADGQDGMDIEDDDDGAGGGGDGDSDGENGECEAGMARPRCTPPPGAGPLPGMEWEANVMHPEPPLHESDSAPHAATVEAMRDAHVAEMLQRAAAVQARKSEVETRVGDWQARILPLLEQQDERPPFDIHVYGDLILSALEQKQMQQQQQQQQRRQQQQEEEEMGQREEGQQQEQLCEDLFENVINTPHAYEVPRYFSALLQLVNNGNVSLSVDPDGLVQPSNLSFSHPPSASSSRSSVAPPVRASTSNTSSPPSASVSDPSSGPRCFSRGSSFSVRLHSLNRRQEELRGYVAPSQRQEGGSGAGKARGEGRRKGNRQHGEESQGEEHQWEGSACADAVGEAGGCDYSDGGAGRDGRGRPASRDGCSGLGGGSSKGGSASGRDKKDSAQRKRKARDRELPPLPPASWPPSAVPSSSLSEQEQEWKDSENQGSEGSRMRVVRNGGILTESSKGVNGREVPGAGRNNKSRKVLDENKEEGEVEEEREEQSGDGEEEDEGCGRTERSEVGEMRRCREQEEMLRHHDGKRQKQDGAQETGGGLSGGTSLGGSSLGAHSNGGSSQRCAEAVRGSSAAASVLGEGNASSPVPVARRRDPRGNSLLRKFVAARLERSRSWKERMSFQRIKRKLGTDCVMQPLFSIQQELAETSRFQKRRRESEKADTCAARCSSAQGVNIAGAVVRPERFKRQW